MQTREIAPLKQGIDLTLTLPGSKSITNRAFLCAALAKGKSRIYGALQSDDTAVMLKALKQLGVAVKVSSDFLEITGMGGRFKTTRQTLNLHNAGTATRFLTSIMAIREGETVVTGDRRMQERPIGDLVDGLLQLGADIQYQKAEGYPPLKIRGKVLEGGVIKVKGDQSSQYFSSLFMLAPLLSEGVTIQVMGKLVSKPYIDTTMAVMKAFGIRVINEGYKVFKIRPQKYKPARYRVEGDASAATYFSAIQFLHGGKLKFTNLSHGSSIQGDAGFVKALKLLKTGTARRIDMESMPDAAMTLACVAPFAGGTTTITGLSTLRIKETDRLLALKTELRKAGAKVSATKHSITVSGRKLKGATIKTYNDHRMAMCFAVLGTKVPGIVIENPDCTDKTYPGFWEDLEKAYMAPIRLGRKNLLLTGMRCSGKTHHGKRIAKRLKRRFVDLDAEIEKAAAMKISTLVKRKGWPYFRKLEQKICSSFEEAKDLVIAAGGGVVLSPKNMKALRKNSVNVFIFADLNTLRSRIARDKSRPPLKGGHTADEIGEVWQERRNLYYRYADFVWDDTSGKPPLQNVGFEV